MSVSFTGDFSSHIAINFEDLENELIKQPNLFCFYVEKMVQAKEKEDKGKEALKVLMADTYNDIKNNFLAYGLPKAPTEAQTNAMVTVNNVVVEKGEECKELKYEVEILKAAVDAINVKKSSLDNLVRLRVMSNYSEHIPVAATKDERDRIRAEIANGARR